MRISVVALFFLATVPSVTTAQQFSWGRGWQPADTALHGIHYAVDGWANQPLDGRFSDRERPRRLSRRERAGVTGALIGASVGAGIARSRGAAIGAGAGAVIGLIAGRDRDRRREDAEYVPQTQPAPIAAPPTPAQPEPQMAYRPPPIIVKDWFIRNQSGLVVEVFDGEEYLGRLKPNGQMRVQEPADGYRAVAMVPDNTGNIAELEARISPAGNLRGWIVVAPEEVQ